MTEAMDGVYFPQPRRCLTTPTTWVNIKVVVQNTGGERGRNGKARTH